MHVIAERHVIAEFAPRIRIAATARRRSDLNGEHASATFRSNFSYTSDDGVRDHGGMKEQCVIDKGYIVTHIFRFRMLGFHSRLTVDRLRQRYRARSS